MWILRTCAASHPYVDYCSLPCKNPFTSAIVANSACACITSGSCGNNPEVIPPTEEEQSYIIQIHNELRNRVASGKEVRGRNVEAANIAALEYDEHMQHVAQCHTNKCIASSDECRRTQDFQTVGQNFYLSYTKELCVKKDIFKDAINSWYEEVTGTYTSCLLRYTGCASQFTQLVWAETTNVGCGRILFYDTCHIFCNYAPAGNIVGQPVYLFGKRNCTPDDQYSHLCKLAANHRSFLPSNVFQKTYNYIFFVLILWMI